MLNITDVSGATFDEATGQIILYGKNPVSLPQMKLDDLSVAVKSVYGYGGKDPQDPGVSIGTEPSSIPGQMKVRYDGQTHHTGFGYTMFESDRLLKNLTLGKDNITGQTVTSSVSGYLNLPDRYRLAGSSYMPGASFTNRMWFVPKQISLVQSTDNSSMLFDTTTMELLTESKFQNNVTGNAVAEAFADHFTSHYDDFANERPILHELKRLGKITAVVKWIKDNNIPFDLSYFDNYVPAYDTRTPDYTPSTSVKETWWENGYQFYSLTITGGVQYHLDASNFSSAQGATADQAQLDALAARPGEENFNWNFSSEGQTYQAIAQSLSRSQKDGNVKRSEIDMMFPALGNNPLVLFRYYNSFNDKATGFGFGWETSPYKLRFPATKMLFTFSGQSVTVSAYYQIFVNEKGREHLYVLVGLDGLMNPIYAREGGMDYLKAESGGFVLYQKNQGTVTFDGDGTFTRITDSNGISIDYAYSGSKLVSITHQGGRAITFNYTGDRITSAVGPGGKTVTYFYNANGDLERVTNEAEEAVVYQYDNDRRLSNVIDPRGNAVFQASFDDYNRSTGETLGGSASFTKDFNLAARMSTITDPKNVSYTQMFDADYRLQSMTDTMNRKVDISYDPSGYGPSSVTDSKDNMTEYGYDDAGNVNYVKDAKGNMRLFSFDANNNLSIARDARGYDTAYVYDLQDRIAEVRHVAVAELGTDGRLNGNYSYDPGYVTVYTYDPVTGKLQSVKDPAGRTQQFTYDENGMPKTNTLPGGYTVTNAYDARSRLQTVTNSAGEGITYTYDSADRVTSTTTSAGTVRNVYDKNGNVAVAYDAKNNATSYAYNINNKVVKVTDAEGGVTSYSYDSTDTRLTHITLPNGSIKMIEYDSLNRPIKESNYVTDTAAIPVVLQSAVNMGGTTAGVPSSRQVKVCNTGHVSTSISNVTSSNALFTISPTSATLAPQQCADLTVSFNGTAMGSQSGTLTIPYDDGSTATVDLSAEVVVSLNVRVASSSNGIIVSWDQYTDPARFSQYRVYRSTSEITTLSGLTPIATISSISSTSGTDTTAVMGTKYYYSVVAFDSSSNMLTSVVSVGPINYLNIGKIGSPLTLTATANGGRTPDIAYNSNASYQNYLVVYEYDASGAGTNWDIYGQRVTGDGQALGAPFAILKGAYNERNPRVAYNSTNNEYLVLAEYNSNNAGLYQIKGQRVTATGLLTGGTFSVYATTKAQYVPDLAYNSRDNNYLVTFESDHTGDTKNDILNLQVSATGTLLAGRYLSTTAGSFRKPRIVFNPSANEHFEVFEYLDAGNFVYIEGLRLNSAGAPLTNYIAIDSFASYNGSYPDVVYNPTNNEYVVAWQYDTYGNGSMYSAYARKVSATGTAGTYINYSSSSISLLWPTILHYADKNEYFIVWTSQTASNGENNVIGQRVYASNLGLITTLTVSISAETSRIERKAGVVYNPARTEFMTAYEYVNGTELDVRTQRIGNVTENLSATPSSLDFGTATSQLTTRVADTTGQSYIYLINAADQPWLSVSPGAIFSTATAADLTVTVSRNVMGVGSYSGNVLVKSNGLVTKVPVTVSVVNGAPSAPANPSPQNNSSAQFNIGNSLTANLGWDCADPNYGDALVYEVYMSENQALVNNSDPAARISTGGSAKSVTTPPLKYGKTYYWRVQARDSYTASTLGPVWSFTTVPIPVPALVAYAPNPTKNVSPTLSWNSVPGIGKYRLQVSTTNTFSSLLADYPSVTATTQTVSQTLPNGTLYWRVAAIDGDGLQGAFSPVEDFAIDTVPPTVQIASPSGLAGKRPLLNYTVSEGTVKVKVDGVVVSKVAGNNLEPLNLGAHTLRVEALDAAGNLGFAEAAFTVEDIPLTSITPAPGNYSAPQSVTLACNDGSGSGCATTYYCLGAGCAPSLVYTGPLSVAKSTDVSFYSKDIAGNVEAVQTKTYTIALPRPALKALSAGYYHTAAVKIDDTLWSWGNNDFGQLGDGTLEKKTTPVQIGTAADWTAVAAGAEHTVALKSDGTLWAWGNNLNGQLGDGTVEKKTIPLQIGTATGWTAIAAGAQHTVALKSDGTVWAWGNNLNGQLGDGTIEKKTTPVRIGTAADWAAVAAGAEHTVALKSDGTLWAWGNNLNGQLGDGTIEKKTTPVRIGTAADWTAVAAGAQHTVALKSDGTLWAWGNNLNGQLGDGTLEKKTTPVRIGTAADWTAVAAGAGHTVALKSDDTLWAWGHNDNGQLGDGTTENKNVAVKVLISLATPSSIGVLSAGSEWYLDANGNGAWDNLPADRVDVFGNPGVLPVSGDWNGDRITEIGVYDPATAQWYLDYNGNGLWDGDAVDRNLTFGSTGSIPVTGDWNGDRVTEIGVYDPATAQWRLDYNGNGLWDGDAVDRNLTFGSTGGIPVTGDWNGDRITEIGVYDPATAQWRLDMNGNGLWDGTPTDVNYWFGGQTGAMPVTGDWDGNRISNIGIFDHGTWYVDYNGNGQWDGTPGDRLFNFGLADDRPVSGKWK